MEHGGVLLRKEDRIWKKTDSKARLFPEELPVSMPLPHARASESAGGVLGRALEGIRSQQRRGKRVYPEEGFLSLGMSKVEEMKETEEEEEEEELPLILEEADF